MASKRKYPVGIQSFEKLRTDGYVYVDKTPLVYKMITEGKPYFLNRPRRFGKSLLCSTLEAVFLGRRELFEAFTTDDGLEQPRLFIATTDWRWEPHPVIRFDFSRGKVYTVAALEEMIDLTLRKHEREYGLTPREGEGDNSRFIAIVEEPTAKGRSDMVLKMPKGIYIIELKYDDTADNALAQIDSRGYADKYRLDGRPVTKVGMAFSSEERNITEWKSDR